jgi:WD40 repeat protein
VTATGGDAIQDETNSPETVSIRGENSAPPAPLPKPFGDYEILREIARGGMGVVYRARQISLNRTVALKMIRAGEFASDEKIERFCSEAEAAAMLSHPHIVSIYEIGKQPGRQYFSMQLIEGESLAAALLKGRWRADGRESCRRAVQLLATVARAVHYAHQRGILHRDLKPGNILLDEGGRPFVTDFGLAKRVEGDSALTHTGSVVGTASYMSPEQASAARNLTTATDVYSLGAILYELLTGRPPHRSGSFVDTLVLVRQQDPIRPRSIEPRVNFDLETICLKCLERDPARRYGSAEALAEDLERWLHYEPILARRSTLMERAGKWARRQPMIAAMTASILLLSAIGFAAVTLLWQDAAGARDDEKQQRHHAEEAKRQEQEQRRRFQRLYIEQLLDKVANLNDKNEAASAALWLAHGLQVVSPEDQDLERILRTNLGELHSQLAPLKAMLPHQKTVRVAAFSGDGKRVLTGGDDTMACLWDAETGKLLVTIKHAHQVQSAAFSPDDRFIAIGTQRDGVQLWHADGKAVGPRLDHPMTVTALIFSPDGKRLLSYCGDFAVRLWNVEDVESAQLIGELRNDTTKSADRRIHGMTFSPNSRLVATVGAAGFSQLWDAGTGKPVGPSLHQTNIVRAVEFRNNNNVAMGGEEGLKYFAVGKEQPSDEIRGVGTILTLDYSPAIKMLAAGGNDGNARLITGTSVRSTLRHNDRVSSIVFSRDGKMLLTGSEDQTARLWDCESGLALGMPYSLPCPVNKVAFGADDRTILAQGPDKIVRLWKTPGPDAVRPLLAQDNSGIPAVAYSPDGKRVVAAGGIGVPGFRVWDADTGELVCLNKDLEKPLRCVVFHPDGQLFLAGGADKTARLWDARTAMEVGKPCRHDGTVSLAMFRPDGKAFVTVVDGTARIWNTITQEPVGKPMRSKRLILAAAFSPDGKLLLTAGGEAGLDGVGAQLWDATTGESLGEALKHPAEILRAVAFSPDGRLACTAGDDAVRLWDMSNRELRAELPHNVPVEAVVFSHDSKSLLTGSDDHAARLWNVVTGKLRLPPILHARGVQAVAFSADDRLIATGCRDQAARIWDAGIGKLISTPRRLATTVRLVAFSPDGKTLLTSGFNAARCIRLWPVPAPVAGDVKRLTLWTQVLTGMELSNEGVVNALDAEQWHERRDLLQRLGGPP